VKKRKIKGALYYCEMITSLVIVVGIRIVKLADNGDKGMILDALLAYSYRYI
jgi:hypothetical protein